MNKNFLNSILFLAVLGFLFMSCNQKKKTAFDEKSSVYIKKDSEKYTVYRNGEPFVIKGASGFTNLKALKEAGGNTIRVWDTLHLKDILDSASHYQIAVVVGLPMLSSEYVDGFYNDDIKTKRFEKDILTIVNKFKNHPSVLFWCLGNELVFPNRPKYNKFYETFNKIVSLIHVNDPNHPVTTTLLSVQKKNIFNITFRTEIDFLSFNIFGALKTFSTDIKSIDWFWKGPFLITEWGIEGPWTTDFQNAWGAYIESTSTKKAEQYLELYQKYMPYKDPRYLGSMVFYWGQKQELTPTWFSLFDENGIKTEAVNVMQYIWTGKKATATAPLLNYMLLNGKGAKDNIFLKPGAIANGEVLFTQSNQEELSYRWELMKEDWHKPNGIFSEKKPEKLEGLILENKGVGVKFKIPDQEGPYRLFVYIYNHSGYLATANTPFYAISNP